MATAFGVHIGRQNISTEDPGGLWTYADTRGLRCYTQSEAYSPPRLVERLHAATVMTG